MSHSNIVIEKVYEYLISNKPTLIDVEFKNDFLLDEHEITQEEVDNLPPSEVEDGIMLISIDDITIPQEQILNTDIGDNKPLNTIYYDYDLIKVGKNFGCIKHKYIKFMLTIKTEKDRLEYTMNDIIDHYYKVIYIDYKAKIPLSLDNGSTRYIYIREEPVTEKVKNVKDDISEYKMTFECFYVI